MANESARPCLSFLTDYGLQDGFVAACHGVIAGLAPEARIIDVTHLVPPGDIRAGAALLAQTAPYLPAHTVHIGVVDPGVGTARRPVVVRAGGGALLVGPDNGLLLPAAEALGGVAEVHELTARRLMLEQVSHTFHGRDVFAPAAARLAAGEAVPADAGPALDPAALVRLPEPRRRLRASGAAEGEVVTVDRFGNVQTSLDAELLHGMRVEAGQRVRVLAGGQAAGELAVGRTFGDVPSGEPIAYLDSAGLFTLAVNGGSAAARLGLEPGTALVVERV